MALLRRGVTNVSMYLIGSSYRIKIPMPNTGDCWFTVDQSQTISSFFDEIRKEDSQHILTLQTESPSKLFREAAEEGVYLKINGLDFFLKWNEMVGSISSKPMLDHLIEDISNADIKTKKELEEAVLSSLAKLGEQYGSYLSALKTSVHEIDMQIRAINEKEREIKSKIKAQTRAVCFIGLSYLTAQWGFFYYTIYQVDWLGWDLMEPITFTVGQTGFLLSLFYYIRTQDSESYEAILSRIENREKQRLLREHKVDVGRIKFLEEEKRRIKSLVEVIEQRLV